MVHDSDTLNLIRGLFPGREQLIEHAFHDQGSFRDLCEGYRRCVEARQRWEQLSGAEAPPQLQEYTELLAELSQEIETWLDAAEPRQTDPQSIRP